MKQIYKRNILLLWSLFSDEFMSPVIEQFKIKNEKWRIPPQFKDVPGVKPSSSFSLDMLLANNPTFWCYTELTSSKVCIIKMNIKGNWYSSMEDILIR